MARRLTAKEKIGRLLDQHTPRGLLAAVLPHVIERAADLADPDHETPAAFWEEIRADLISDVDVALTAARSMPGDNVARRLAEIDARAQSQAGLTPERRPPTDLDAAIRRAFGISVGDDNNEGGG